MILLHGTREGEKEGELLLMVLEPGNFSKLKRGQPIVNKLEEFIPGFPRKIELVICYTPDIEWVVAQLQGKPPTMEAIGQALDASLVREPVSRDSEDAESVKRVSL